MTVRGIIRNGDRILVSREEWPKGKRFFLPPGGGINFREYAEHAIKREIREELRTEVEDVRYIGFIENMFENSYGLFHGFEMIYEVELKDKSLYELEIIEGIEDDMRNPELYGFPRGPIELKFVWKSLEEMNEEGLPLYPSGLERLL